MNERDLDGRGVVAPGRGRGRGRGRGLMNPSQSDFPARHDLPSSRGYDDVLTYRRNIPPSPVSSGVGESTGVKRSRDRSSSPEVDHGSGSNSRRTMTTGGQSSIGNSSSSKKQRSLSQKEKLEAERRARMDRLRAENEAEEKKMALSNGVGGSGRNRDGSVTAASFNVATSEFILVDRAELEGLEDEEQMMKLLGFSGGFATTKGRAVEDNSTTAARGAAAKNKARKYRQYMNRKGGFNRPLDKMP
eukprot:CAMPEP_0172509580 /NCGR_PEP_ID=MMETSP1066-20121228/221396_1 /TAXON_ID=671091 /ORGANISM="Coscinodiscus wailesii, Strain CCMP2513" /LENGTH=245 /DNA_ID=CAMNT_0013288135 /DNA_START=35 /DNA_END=769 /DNA_ORIENTATION=+